MPNIEAAPEAPLAGAADQPLHPFASSHSGPRYALTLGDRTYLETDEMTPAVPFHNNDDLGRYSLRVNWYESDAETDFRLTDVESVRQLILSEDLWPDGFSSDCPSPVVVLEALASLANPDFDELHVNGMIVVVAHRTEGGHCFVPSSSNEEGVEVLGSGSASWLSGGPCVFDQSEELLRLGDLYWVDTRGDVEQQRVVVGRFPDPSAGLAAAVEASIFFSFDANGELHCELDNWPQDE